MAGRLDSRNRARIRKRMKNKCSRARNSKRDHDATRLSIIEKFKTHKLSSYGTPHVPLRIYGLRFAHAQPIYIGP